MKETKPIETKMQFATKSYLNELEWKFTFKLLVITTIIYAFKKPIQLVTETYLINPILSKTSNNEPTDILILALLLSSIYFTVSKLHRGLIPAPKSILTASTIFILYKLIFGTDEGYTFHKFTIPLLSKMHYADFAVFIITLFTITYRSYSKPLELEYSFDSLIEDNPNNHNDQDINSRVGYAVSIANHINKTSSSNAIAIGLFAKWGSGKTAFMLRLNKQLSIENNNNLIIEFNPWRLSSENAIIEDFFKSIAKALKPYNHSVTAILAEYSSRILKPAKETYFRAIDTFIGEWINNENTDDKYEQVNKIILSTGKRLIIFIDDLDRLTSKEIIEIFRLIRNTANFANTFYIVGIDQEYVTSVLQNSKTYANEQEYLKKVFQVSLILPAPKKDGFINELRRLIITEGLSEPDKQLIEQALSKISASTTPALQIAQSFQSGLESGYILDDLLDNYRDVKRLANSFKISFKILKNEVEIADLLVLELIRNSEITVYEEIRNRSFLESKLETPHLLEIDKPRLTKFLATLKEEKRGPIERAIDFLFSHNESKNQRRLQLAHNYYLYFSYQLFNLISFKSFNDAIRMQSDEMTNVFELWKNENKAPELSRLFQYIADFENTSQLKEVSITLFRLSEDNRDFFYHASRLVLTHWLDNHRKYFKDDRSEHRIFLQSIIEDRRIPIYARANLTNDFLKAIRNGRIGNVEFIFTREELSAKLENLFVDYLSTNPLDTKEIEGHYKLNDFVEVNERVKFSKTVNSAYLEYLLNNKLVYEDYIKNTIRPYYIPYNGLLTYAPWLPDIFESWQNFIEILDKHESEDEVFTKFKRIILEQIKLQTPDNREPFQISDPADKQFIENYHSLIPHYI